MKGSKYYLFPVDALYENRQDVLSKFGHRIYFDKEPNPSLCWVMDTPSPEFLTQMNVRVERGGVTVLPASRGQEMDWKSVSTRKRSKPSLTIRKQIDPSTGLSPYSKPSIVLLHRESVESPIQQDENEY
jgi:hypothetical protein